MNVGHAMTRAMALNYCALTESSVRTLDIPAFRTRSLWWRRPGPPAGGDGVYIAALIFDSHATDERIFDELNEVHTKSME